MRPAALTVLAGISTAALGLTLGLTSTRRDELLELASLGLVLGHGLLVVIAGAYALGQWTRRRWVALAPMALLLAGIPLVPRVRDLDRVLTDERFGRHFSAFEAAVHRLELDPGEVTRPRPEELPPNPLCCYRAFVRRSPGNDLSALFQVGPRLAYLYDPAGSAWSEGVSARWRDHKSVGTHWYRLAR